MTWSPQAPAWVWQFPGLDVGTRMCLLGLWSLADWDASSDADVWAPKGMSMAAYIAALTAQTDRAVRAQLAKLRAAGLIETDGRRAGLAWKADDVTVWRPEKPSKRRGTPSQRHAIAAASDDITTAMDASPVACDATTAASHLTHPDPILIPSNSQREREPTARPAPEAMRPMTESQSPVNMAKHAGHSAQIVASHAAKHGPTPTREPAALRSPLDLLDDGVWRALANHSVTGMLALNTSSQWSVAFCEVAGAYRLTPAEVTALLDRWEAERASLLDQVAAEKAGTFPALRALWFSNGAANAKNREWITDRIASIRRVDAPPRERWADKVARENRENRERYQALRAEVPS